MMKSRWRWLVSVLIPVAVGALSGVIAREGMELYPTLNQPALAPPGWLFPVVWTALYIFMGTASYLVFTSGAPEKKIGRALQLYTLQLIVNFFWSIFFFNFSLYLFSFFWLLLLWVLVIGTGLLFYRLDETAGYLFIPYFLWVTFAAYLNLSTALLNG